MGNSMIDHSNTDFSLTIPRSQIGSYRIGLPSDRHVMWQTACALRNELNAPLADCEGTKL